MNTYSSRALELSFITLPENISDNIQMHFARPGGQRSPMLIPLVTSLSTGTIERQLLMKRTHLIKLINTDRSAIGNFL